MTNTMTLLMNLAVAMSLAGSLAVSAASPSFARSPIAVHKHHQSAAAIQRHQSASSAYGSAPPTDLCRQTGPITMPATNPICNRRGWFRD
jgi:hypothetical protein